jgi:DNA repair protein RecO
MSYRIYQTESFVLSSRSDKEANKYFKLFTEELGVIGATAQGVRLLKSKLRYGLTDFSYVSVAVLRAKHAWKITSAKPVANAYTGLSENPNGRDAFVRVLALVARLTPGEEPNRLLFQTVRDGFLFLQSSALSADESLDAECVLVLRILHLLGYLGSDDVLAPFLDAAASLDRALIASAASVRRRALAHINRSLEATQL